MKNKLMDSNEDLARKFNHRPPCMATVIGIRYVGCTMCIVLLYDLQYYHLATSYDDHSDDDTMCLLSRFDVGLQR